MQDAPSSGRLATKQIAAETRARRLAADGQYAAATRPTGRWTRRARWPPSSRRARLPASRPPDDARSLGLSTNAISRGDRRGAGAGRRPGADRGAGPGDAPPARRPRPGAPRSLAAGNLDAAVEPSGPRRAAGARRRLQRDGRRPARPRSARSRRSAERLAVTIESLGDALIVTEPGSTQDRQPSTRARPSSSPSSPSAARSTARTARSAAVDGARRRGRRSSTAGARWPSPPRGSGSAGRRRRVDGPRHDRARPAGARQERVRRHRLARAAQPADLDQGVRRAARALAREHVRAPARVRRDHPASRPTGSSSSSTTCSTSRGSRPTTSRSTARPIDVGEAVARGRRADRPAASPSKRPAARRLHRPTTCRSRWPTRRACARSWPTC